MHWKKDKPKEPGYYLLKRPMESVRFARLARVKKMPRGFQVERFGGSYPDVRSWCPMSSIKEGTYEWLAIPEGEIAYLESRREDLQVTLSVDGDETLEATE